MADPVLSPSQETAVYRPVAGLAVAGLALACVFALILVGSGLVSFFRGLPLLLADWVLAIPLAGFIISFLGARQIRNSEGTRAGLKVATYGLWISAVCGLSYFVYFKTLELALTRQANDFLMRVDDNSGFFPRLQAAREHPAEQNRAFLLTRFPVERRRANPDQEQDMHQKFNLGQEGGVSGFLGVFRQNPLVQSLRCAGADAQIEPLGVQDWHYSQGSYIVTRVYRITTPEAVRQIALPVQSIDGEAGGSRQWRVVLGNTIKEVAAAKPTELGKRLAEYRLHARLFLGQWLQDVSKDKGFDFPSKDRTPWELAVADPDQRTAVRNRLNAQFAEGGRGQLNLQPFKKEEEVYIPYERTADKLRLTFRAQLYIPPLYSGEMQIVLETKYEPEGEVAPAWDIHEVQILYVAASSMRMPGPPGK